MKNVLKYLEILFFLMINIVFASFGACYIVLLIIIFEEKIDEFLKLLTIHKAIPIYYFNMGSDFVANHIGMVLAICFTYIVSNIFIATILIDRQEIKT